MGDADGNVVDGVTLPNIDLPAFPTKELATTFGELTKSIGGISDATSAEAVLPKLQEAATLFDGLDLGAIAAGPQKDAVDGMLGGLIDKLKVAVETAYAIPGVKGILQPVVDPFLQRFAPFGL